MEVDPSKLTDFFKGVFDKSGYDFRDYSRASLERRVAFFNTRYRFQSLDDLQSAIFSREDLFKQFVDSMTVQVTEMFRDPTFYLALRQKVVDLLRTYPRIKIWHAGCSNGAEVYSMAILLRESGLANRTQIYATDINEGSLKQAYDGVFPLRDMRLYTENYQRSGGLATFSDYYRADDQSAIIDRELKKNITFAFHNLVTDWVFTEAQMVICRNVLIYFNRDLQNRVLKLFKETLVRGGILGLGSKESLRFSDVANDFEWLDKNNRLFVLRGSL